MERKIICIAFILRFILSSYGQLMNDVCLKDDVDCEYPKIKHTGELQHRKCQLDNVLRRIPETTLLKCVKECMVTSQCVGINYRKNWKMCDVVGYTDTPLKEEPGCMYSEIVSWPEALAGRCADHPCEEGNKCTLNGRDLICEPAYCQDLPNTKNISVIEKFGLHRTLNTGSKADCNAGFKTTGRPYVICKKNGTWTRPICCIPSKPEHCGELPECSKSGVYRIYPSETESEGFEVFCDMETDNGGWTVFQKRFDGSVSFYRTWTEYEDGFGSPKGEYWMGNKHLYEMTSHHSYVLRVDLEDFNTMTRYAQYKTFSIGDSNDTYRLTIGAYSGDAGDSLSYSNGMSFTTKDQDNDLISYNCAEHFKGAWWYNACHHANLNGLYLGGPHTSFADGIEWRTWTGLNYSLKSVKMMIPRQ